MKEEKNKRMGTASSVVENKKAKVTSNDSYKLSPKELKQLQPMFEVDNDKIDKGTEEDIEKRKDLFPYYELCEVKNDDYYNATFDKLLLDIKPEEYWVEFSVDKAAVDDIEEFCKVLNLDLLQVRTRVQLINELISTVRRVDAKCEKETGKSDNLSQTPDYLPNHAYLNRYTFYSKDKKLTCTARFYEEFDETNEKTGKTKRAAMFHFFSVTAEVHIAAKACLWWADHMTGDPFQEIFWRTRTG